MSEESHGAHRTLEKHSPYFGMKRFAMPTSLRTSPSWTPTKTVQHLRLAGLSSAPLTTALTTRRPQLLAGLDIAYTSLPGIVHTDGPSPDGSLRGPPVGDGRLGTGTNGSRWQVRKMSRTLPGSYACCATPYQDARAGGPTRKELRTNVTFATHNQCSWCGVLQPPPTRQPTTRE